MNLYVKDNGSEAPAPWLELWGGVECSVVRINDSFRDQIRETGHYHRIEDLGLIADLGIRTLRYPVVWETVSPDHPDEQDWTWHDARLRRLKELLIEPIVGLVHHGSGTRYANLHDDGFSEGLARHAEQVAMRYPWLRLFTPVNEPVTTARFSSLYGHWFPHRRDNQAFLRAVVTQCRGVVLAMKAIRRVIPHAQLVQTEDMGKVFSTERMRYQADYENERRWLSFDLLCGHVVPGHPLYAELVNAGISEREIAFFEDGSATPDLFGINHYLTSDRYIDERLHLFPDFTHGGNAWDRYADTEALRVDLPLSDLGPAARLREAWQRYRRPLAITEVHNGSGNEEQVGWLMEAWQAAERLRFEGADIRAVTVWSLFGAVDWDSLMVENLWSYESGAFDVRHETPLQTILGKAVEILAKSGGADMQSIRADGWWRQDHRILYRAACSD
jgi:dTDP-4-dehydrorhamnose reductase